MLDSGVFFNQIAKYSYYEDIIRLSRCQSKFQNLFQSTENRNLWKTLSRRIPNSNHIALSKTEFYKAFKMSCKIIFNVSHNTYQSNILKNCETLSQLRIILDDLLAQTDPYNVLYGTLDFFIDIYLNNKRLKTFSGYELVQIKNLKGFTSQLRYLGSVRKNTQLCEILNGVSNIKINDEKKKSLIKFRITNLGHYKIYLPKSNIDPDSLVFQIYPDSFARLGICQLAPFKN